MLRWCRHFGNEEHCGGGEVNPPQCLTVMDVFSCFYVHVSQHPVDPNAYNVLTSVADLSPQRLWAGSRRMKSHRGKRSSLHWSSSRYTLFTASRARVQHSLPRQTRCLFNTYSTRCGTLGRATMHNHEFSLSVACLCVHQPTRAAKSKFDVVSGG